MGVLGGQSQTMKAGSPLNPQGTTRPGADLTGSARSKPGRFKSEPAHLDRGNIPIRFQVPPRRSPREQREGPAYGFAIFLSGGRASSNLRSRRLAKVRCSNAFAESSWVISSWANGFRMP